jgi:hypothetical protein
MIHTFAFNPFIGMIIAVFSHIPFLIVLIFTQVPYFHKESKLPLPTPNLLFRLLTGLFFGLFIVLSLLLFDIGLSWIFGAWTYADWRFQLPSVILILLIATNFIGWIVFRKFSVFDLLYVVIASIVLIIFLHIAVPSNPVMGITLEAMIIPVLLVLIVSYIPLYLIKTKKISINSFKDLVKTVEFDIRKKILFSPLVNFLVWILATAQTLLILTGYSLFG